MHKNVTIRAAQESDLPFIFSTWLKGLYHGNEFFSLINKEAYFSNYHAVVTQILMRSTVQVACLIEDPDVVLGYSVSKGGTLHWVFVKKAWRKLGIAKMLVPASIDTVTHLTKIGQSLRKPGWAFNPFQIT